jgi:hypothetical protein
MKTLLVVVIAAAALTGCVVAPIDPVPGVYVGPPAVVVAPHYRHPGYHRHHGHYRHRHWR